VTDISSDLSVLIAEPHDVMADLDTPVAESYGREADLAAAIAGSYESEADLDAAIAETHDLSVDLEMRIRVEQSRLAGLDMRIESPWTAIQESLQTYEERFIRLQSEGATVSGVLMGAPEIFVLHRLTDNSVVKCDKTSECENCTKPRRVIVAWNFYDQVEQDLRILVCDEVLSHAMIQAIGSSSIEERCIRVQNLGRPENSYRDFQYQVELTGRPEHMVPGFFDHLKQLSWWDLRVLDVTKLVGSMI